MLRFQDVSKRGDASDFILNIAPARKTEVIGLLALEPSYRRLVERGKSFNIFVAR